MCMYLQCSTINLCFEAWRKCSGKVWSVILFIYVMVTSRATKKSGMRSRPWLRPKTRSAPSARARFVNLARHRSATYSQDKPHAVLYTPLHQMRVLTPLLALILALPHIVGTNHSTLLYIKRVCWRLFCLLALILALNRNKLGNSLLACTAYVQWFCLFVPRSWLCENFLYSIVK